METLAPEELKQCKYCFHVSSNTQIWINLYYGGQPWGKGINALIRFDDERGTTMQAMVAVYTLDGDISTPLGSIQSWDFDKRYKPKYIKIKSGKQFLNLTKRVGEKMLGYW